MKTALDEAGEDVRHYYDLWKAAERREARLRDIVIQQDTYIRASLPYPKAQEAERERLIALVNEERERANPG